MVSIPFEQGDVFRQIRMSNQDKKKSQSLSNRAMSFDKGGDVKSISVTRLNPFRTGRCLSTEQLCNQYLAKSVSIPFEQGDVFRLQLYAGGRNHAVFQTHFPIFLEG